MPRSHSIAKSVAYVSECLSRFQWQNCRGRSGGTVVVVGVADARLEAELINVLS